MADAVAASDISAMSVRGFFASLTRRGFDANFTTDAHGLTPMREPYECPTFSLMTQYIRCFLRRIFNADDKKHLVALQSGVMSNAGQMIFGTPR